MLASTRVRFSAHRLRAWLAAWIALTVAAAAESPLRNLRTARALGEDYVALSDLASFYGLRAPPVWARSPSLRSEWTHMDFEENSRKFLFNGLQVWLHLPTTRVRYRWSIAARDVAVVIDPLLRPGLYLKGRGCRVVVLDPGHGGQDRGASGWRGVEEKRVVLDVCRRARTLLANEGFKVYLTREGDRYLTLEERCRLAAAWRGDVFVSVHLNASRSAASCGVETYVLAAAGYPSTNASQPARTPGVAAPGNRHDEANTILGAFLQKELARQLRAPDRGLRRARFLVLKEAPCPAALVEGGFVSNRAEAERMLDAAYRETLAKAIADGVLNYARAVRRANAATPSAAAPESR